MTSLIRSETSASEKPTIDNINDFSIQVHSFDDLQSRRSDLLNRHENLNNFVSQRRLRLQQLAIYQDWQKNSTKLKNWIEDKIKAANLYLKEDEEELNNFTAENFEMVEIKLNKHIVIEAEVEKNVGRLDTLDNEHNNFQNLSEITEDEIVAASKIILELRDMWALLLNLLDQRNKNLKRQTKLLKFYRQSGVFLFWVNEKMPMSESNDCGNNVDECNLIIGQYESLMSEMGSYKVKLEKVVELAEELLSDSNQNDQPVHQKLDECNQAWTKINDNIKNRGIQLHNAKLLHQFIADSRLVLKRMSNKKDDINNLQVKFQELEDNENQHDFSDYNNQMTKMENLLEEHKIIENELAATGDKISNLTGRAAKLEQDLENDSASKNILLDNRNELVEHWKELQLMLESKIESMTQTNEILSFLYEATNLINWAENFKNKSISDTTSDKLTEIQAEIGEHKDLNIILNEKVKEFETCADNGKKLDYFERPNMVNKDNILEKLHASLISAQTAWSERDQHLKEVQSYHIFDRESSSILKKIRNIHDQIDEEVDNSSSSEDEVQEKDSNEESKKRSSQKDVDGLRRKRGFKTSVKRQIDSIEADHNELTNMFNKLEHDHYNYEIMQHKKEDIEHELNSLNERLKKLNMDFKSAKALYTYLRDYEILTKNLKDKSAAIKNQPVPKNNVTVAIEQHEQLTKQIDALKPEIDELIHSKDAPLEKASDLSALSEFVNQQAEDKLKKLKEAETNEKFDKQCDDLKSYLDDIEFKVNIPASELCKDMTSSKDAINRHTDLTDDFNQHKNQFDVMKEKAALVGADEVAENLSARYNFLSGKIAEKNIDLNQFLNGYELAAELRDVDEWIQQKHRQVNSKDVGKDLLSCMRYQAKHKDISSEIANNKQKTEALIERGKREKFIPIVPELAENLKHNWNDLNEKNALRSGLLDTAKKTHEYFVEADESIDWLNEKKPVVESNEVGTTEDLADIILSRHKQIIDEIEAYKPRIDELKDLAENCEMDELENNETGQIKSVKGTQATLEDEYNNLLLKANDRNEKLAKNSKALALKREAADLLRWIAEKENEIAESYKEAQAKGDLDTAKKMLERSEKEMRAGQKRLNDLLAEAEANNVDLGDGLNTENIMDNWNKLQNKYEEMNDMLSGAYKLQRFLQDCIETREWIEEKKRILLTIEPNAENINITAINAMRRRHETLQRDLQALGNRVHDLDQTADQLVLSAQEGKLQPQIINDKLIDMDKILDAETIQTKRNDLNIAWNDLVTNCKSRKKQLNYAEQFHRFLGDKNELENWIENMHKVMIQGTETEPSDVADAQNLIDRHQSIFTDLESRNNDFNKLNAKANKLKNNNHPKADMIQDNIEELMNNKRKLNAAWQEKEAKLNEFYKLKKFERDVNLCENWIKNREDRLAKLDQAPNDTDIQKNNNLKKSAEIKRQIDNYQGKIDEICHVADDLLEEDYFAGERVIKLRDDLLNRWNNLLNGLKYWQTKLGNSQQVQQFLDEGQNMNDWLDEKIASFPKNEELINDNDQLKGRQNRQDAIKAEIDANKDKLNKLLDQGNNLIENLLKDNKQGAETNEDVEKIMQAINNLQGKMNDLEDLSVENAGHLSDAAQQLYWHIALKDFEMWVDELRTLIDNSNLNFSQLEEAQNAAVKHNQRINEIKSNKPRLNKLENEAENLKNSGKFSSEDINNRLGHVQHKYEDLVALANRRDRALTDKLNALELYGNILAENDYVDRMIVEVKQTKEPNTKTEAEGAIRSLDSIADDIHDRKNRNLNSMQDQARELASHDNELKDGLDNLNKSYNNLDAELQNKRCDLVTALNKHSYNELLSELELWLKNQITIMQNEIQDKPESESLLKALAAKRKFANLWSSYTNVYLSKISDFSELNNLKLEFENLAETRKSMINKSVADQEFQWKCEAVMNWIMERNNVLTERNSKSIRHFSEIDSLIQQHQMFSVTLRVFEESALEALRTLYTSIETLSDKPNTNNQTLLDTVNQNWTVLIDVSTQRQILLEQAKKKFEAFDRLLLEFAQQASSFNTWYEKLEEEFSNPVYADSVEDIRKQKTEFQEIKLSCLSKKDDLKTLSDLNNQILSQNSNTENPYTWHTMTTINELWQQVQVLLQNRENSLSEELNRQEIADRLCHNYASEANKFYDYLINIKILMQDKDNDGLPDKVDATGDAKVNNNNKKHGNQSSNLENHLKNLEKINEDMKNHRNLLTNVEDRAKELEQQGVYDIERYTKHSLVKLSQQYDQLKNQNIKMQHNLIQQINAMNSSGVPEELLRDINIMFKHFDKDNTDYLEHDEFKSCLRALGVDIPIPEDPTEPIPEFEAILDIVDKSRDGKVSINEYTMFMIERETSKVKGTSNVISAFKKISSQEDKPYLTKKDIVSNLSKEQSDWILANMEAYVDENGDVVPDAYDYNKLVDRLFQ